MALCPQHTFQVLTKRPERMRQYVERLGCEMARLAVPACEVSDSPCAAGLVEDRDWPLQNLWLGVSVEDQARADERIPLLLQTPAAVRFISAEPLLGPVDLRRFIGGIEDNPQAETDEGVRFCMKCGCSFDEDAHNCPAGFGPSLDWVIVGGESGPGARPMNLAWAEEIVAQCQAAGVPVFVKQLGSVPVVDKGRWPAADWVRLLSAKNRDKAPEGTVAVSTIGDKKMGDIANFPPALQVRQWPEVKA